MESSTAILQAKNLLFLLGIILGTGIFDDFIARLLRISPRLPALDYAYVLWTARNP